MPLSNQSEWIITEQKKRQVSPMFPFPSASQCYILNMLRNNTHCSKGSNIFHCQCLSNFNYASLKAKVNRIVQKNTFLITEMQPYTTLQHLARVTIVNSIMLQVKALCYDCGTKSEILHESLRCRWIQFRSYLLDNTRWKPAYWVSWLHNSCILFVKITL